MNERLFWTRKMRRLLPRDTFARRVENAMEPGTPDVFYCWRARHGWIENKYRVQAPFYPDTIPFPPARGLRKEQIAWWLEYLRAGGRGLLLVGVGGKSFGLTMTEDLAREFNWLTWSALQERGAIVTTEFLERAL